MDVKTPAVPNLRGRLLHLNVSYLASASWMVVPRKFRWEWIGERATGGGVDGRRMKESERRGIMLVD